MRKSAKPANLPFPMRVFTLGSVLLLMALRTVPAAEISVPRLEMAGRGGMMDGSFVFSTMISADLALSGGYKYAFLLGFSLEAGDIAKAFAYRNFRYEPLLPLETGAGVTEDDYNALADKVNTQADILDNQATLGFRVAKATVRELFGLPLEMSYFLGADDDFCAGDEFDERFGVSPVSTDFRGFYYFPDGIGGIPGRRYNGIYGVRGTGFSFALTKWEKFVPELYLYKDFALPALIRGKDLYSGDLRLTFHHNRFGLEAFGGFSVDTGRDVSIRGGIMIHLAGNGVEFFAQGGIPGWTAGEDFSIDNLFFLIEPRLHFNTLSIYLTFFYHPLVYIHIVTPEEQGKADINIKFQFGKTDSRIFGGFETRGEIRMSGDTSFLFHLSPFISLVSGGLRWDTRINFTPQNYQAPGEMFEFFIGVRTAF